jgi:predicted signal transduction protein with EAL and GGDEF domain
MRAIKDEGFHFALDDFGTGYSALGYLNAYPFDYVKIDQSFVRGLPEHQSDASICKAIISMAHSMGIAVIAEGVEKLEQGQFLAEQLCDQIQGFYFSLPLSVAEAEQWLSTELILPAVMRPAGSRNGRCCWWMMNRIFCRRCAVYCARMVTVFSLLPAGRKGWKFSATKKWM